MGIMTVGLDADDTLWHSETYFAITEDRFQALLAPWCEPSEAAGRLLTRERNNLAVFGYGIKGFTLSMIETAIEASEGSIPVGALQEIIGWGKEMLSHPVELLPGVRDVIDELNGSYHLALITKGDLFHQESKIAESGLADEFDSVDILAEKDAATYGKVLARLGVAPDEFLMVGNSVRSDVLPILELGASAIHIPYSVTWGHEMVEPALDENGNATDERWVTLSSIGELPDHLASLPS